MGHPVGDGKKRMSDSPFPTLILLLYTTFVAVLVPVYWHHYGPGNFLWFSDIALFAVLISLWSGNRLLYSMMAVGVLPIEMLWLVDFIALGKTTGIAGYMFRDGSPLYLRGLSLFHFFLPPMLIWMLWRHGYDPSALLAQTALAWVVLPVTWITTDPDDNINWVFGPAGPQDSVPPLVYLGLYMLLLPIVVYSPMHLLLAKLFAGRSG
jgi:hypothetical protein